MKDPLADDLRRSLDAAGMSLSDLWLRYFALGGTAASVMLDAWVKGVLVPPVQERNLVVQAVNEYFLEQGVKPPLSYLDEG